ncbi:MAG: FAD-dependent oxidoreductase [Planctomycetes bacterium]|nr:FAD-dependent oxidoreductase [Planctomycetota bacterium]MCH9724274.1 FAD-dependent oxidoreductase [Planctomycetota bacterium]MCH9776689.1 FAD-dependent oxidoreductase [Planctomycetota bacterium]MCH9790072.1 FAD-dependent oxidoreductase [Planctomycetota bacterium]
MMTMENRKQTVAIIGAGIGGLSCARQLCAAGFRVRVFDKSRGVGGRISLRRFESYASFDHGAQYFTVKEAAMAQQVESWIADGVVAPWQCRTGSLDSGVWKSTNSETPRYVGVPGMTAIAKHLARDRDVVLQTRVSKVVRLEHGWRLLAEEDKDLGVFDFLILNAPAPQSASLLNEFPRFAQQICIAKFAPCWAVMLALDQRLDVPWDAATVVDSPLSWIARNSSKQGRPTEPDCWVLHGNPDWSTTHLEDIQDVVTARLISSFWQALGLLPQSHRLATAHRWRFALPSEPLEKRCLFDEELRLGACGDWCGGPRIESAYLSGLALAEAVSKIR